MGEREELIDAVREARADRARADATEAIALARLSELDGNDHRALADEVAPELGVSTAEATRRVGRSAVLVRRMPTVLGLMQAGQVEAYGARRLLDVAAPLDENKTRRLDELLAQRLASQPGASLLPDNLTRRVRRLMEVVDPGGQVARARQARCERSFDIRNDDHAMSQFTLRIPAEVAAGIRSRVDALANKVRRKDRDGRTMDQLRADVATDLLLGRSPEVSTPAIAASVFIHLPIDTALGMTEDGCELDGYGPVPGAIAREIMTNPNSTWRAVLCDPGTGRPVDLGRTRRRPTAAVRDLVAARDRECCVPWCHRPARHCEFDHGTAWTDGGHTSTANGSSKCDRHHARKDDPGWTIHHDPDTGTTVVTTPNGATHTDVREPIHAPTRRHHRKRRDQTCRATQWSPPGRQSAPQQPTGQPPVRSRRSPQQSADMSEQQVPRQRGAEDPHSGKRDDRGPTVDEVNPGDRATAVGDV
ncbi:MULTISPECIES: 13E12 repeat family protein [Prauserella salsuginis group]|uniref:13E12 repeat family protein n=1 Tax=Prauserella salsuginis TaxID=387889 RepID=A0ABW6G779_9PSEU|nr:MULTISPECIES: 13E12 repeat family protein [Prauserella salsuginis group]